MTENVFCSGEARCQDSDEGGERISVSLNPLHPPYTVPSRNYCSVLGTVLRLK